MKSLVTILLALSLSSCAVVDIYRQARWDNNEYALVNEIQTQASLGADKCGTKDVVPYVDRIYVKSVEFKNYSADIERNKDTQKMSEELLAITKGLKERYYSGDEVSQKYCELKFTAIETSTGTIKRALGAKPR